MYEKMQIAYAATLHIKISYHLDAESYLQSFHEIYLKLFIVRQSLILELFNLKYS